MCRCPLSPCQTSPIYPTILDGIEVVDDLNGVCAGVCMGAVIPSRAVGVRTVFLGVPILKDETVRNEENR